MLPKIEHNPLKVELFVYEFNFVLVGKLKLLITDS